MTTSCSEVYKPVLAMVAVQSIISFTTLADKAAITSGMIPMVLVVYRQTIGSLVLLLSMLLAKGASLSLTFYYMGLKLTSSSMSTAMANLIPAITFLMATCTRSEEVRCNIKGMAKVFGTLISLAGALCLTFFKGPQVLNQTLISVSTFTASKNWVLGSIFLVICSCCWSISLILQEEICKRYLDPLALATWICVLSAVMSALLALFFEPDLNTWKITAPIQLFSCCFAGTFGAGVCYYLQAWSVSVRGPLFAAIFHPFSNIITTVLAAIMLDEKLYVGSLVGAAGILSGVYIALWGKSHDVKPHNKSILQEQQQQQGRDYTEEITISIDARHAATLAASEESSLTRPLIAETSKGS